MSKIIEATCDAAGLITAQGVIVEDTTILTAGTKASSGILIIDEDKKTYIASSATDIVDLITALVAIIEKITLIATGVDAASNSPGGQTANILALTLLKTQLDLSKETLK